MLVTHRGIFWRLEVGPFHRHEVNPLLSSPLGNRVIVIPVWDYMKRNSFLSTLLAITFITAKHDTSIQHLRSWVSLHLKNPFTFNRMALSKQIFLPDCMSQAARLMPFSRHATFRSFCAFGVEKNTRHRVISKGRTLFWRKNAIIHISLTFKTISRKKISDLIGTLIEPLR